jgi:hypothetical protein
MESGCARPTRSRHVSLRETRGKITLTRSGTRDSFVFMFGFLLLFDVDVEARLAAAARAIE